MGVPFAESMDFREIMRCELKLRQQKNKSYSLRAFARDLKVSVSHLSEILAHDTFILSLAMAERIANNLRYTELDREFFLDTVRILSAVDAHERDAINARLKLYINRRLNADAIDPDHFAYIADWHHLAILTAAEVPALGRNIEYIAERLGITIQDAYIAVARLERLGLIKMDKGKVEVKSVRSVTRPTAPSAAARKFHGQVLKIGAHALEEIPMEKRYVSSTFLTVRQEDLAEAKQFLGSVREQFCERFSNAACADQVWALELLVFPLLSNSSDSKNR